MTIYRDGVTPPRPAALAGSNAVLAAVRAAALAVVLAVATALAAAGCGASTPARTATAAGSTTPLAGQTTTEGHTTSTPTSATSTAPAAGSAAPPARRRRHRHPGPPAWRRALPDPHAGSLPQTDAIPSSHTATFTAEMRVLWDGIRTGSVAPAMPAFFPEAAYAQVKAIGDPYSDWRYRLVGDYALDIAAAHALLGASAHTARLLGVEVPAAGVKYVPANVCENGIGYEEVPNTRIVYRSGGVVRSLGIASLISWRGLWYVVHLGAVVRSADVGMLDDPADGTGVSAPSTTC